MKKLYLLLLIVSSCLFSNAQQIRAVFYNPTGADDGKEYFEIQHTPSTALTGLTLLVIEGDGSGAGVLDKAISLGAHSTGSNGILLWRDNATVLTPAPSAATTLVVSDFAPDLENGTNTYLLVSGFTGTQGTDYDANNDGVLDSTPWTSVQSAVSVTDGGSSDHMYAGAFSGVDLPNTFGTPHGFVLSNGVYYAVTVTGSGPYDINAAWNSTGVANPPVAATILHPGNTSSPLPILLESFTASYSNNLITLEWRTSQELNCLGFEIEHSSNGVDFTNIGFVPTQAENGNAHQTLDYSFLHSKYHSGTNYYRMMQKDINGLGVASDVLQVRTNYKNELEIVSLYPNPIMDQLMLNLYTPINTKVRINILDLAGKLISQEQVSLNAGATLHKQNMSSLASGTYVLHVLGSNGQTSTTLLSKK